MMVISSSFPDPDATLELMAGGRPEQYDTKLSQVMEHTTPFLNYCDR
jgi:hypothetical protein